MAEYYINEGAFDLPDIGFVDRTVHFFEGKSERSEPLGLLMTRTPMPAEKTLREVVEGYISKEALRLRAYSIIDVHDAEWCGAACIDVATQYRNNDALAYQRHVHMNENGLWLLFGATGTIEDRAGVDAMIDEVLGSLRLRGG